MIIAISGKAEAGKTETAKILKRELEAIGKKVLIIHMGDYLKFACKAYLDWNGEKDEAGRQLLQYEGTDYIRERDPDFHTKITCLYISVYKERFDYFLVPDCRFFNEMSALYKVGDTVDLRIERPEHENKLTEDQRKHKTETELDDYDFDYTIVAKTGHGNLYPEVIRFMEVLEEIERKRNSPCEQMTLGELL